MAQLCKTMFHTIADTASGSAMHNYFSHYSWYNQWLSHTKLRFTLWLTQPVAQQCTTSFHPMANTTSGPAMHNYFSHYSDKASGSAMHNYFSHYGWYSQWLSHGQLLFTLWLTQPVFQTCITTFNTIADTASGSAMQNYFSHYCWYSQWLSHA